MQIRYRTSVFTAAGWRDVVVTAEATPISAARAYVAQVIDVDGNGNTGYASRTGAKRQQYNVEGIAKREAGAIKILSRCLEVTP